VTERKKCVPFFLALPLGYGGYRIGHFADVVDAHAFNVSDSLAQIGRFPLHQALAGRLRPGGRGGRPLRLSAQAGDGLRGPLPDALAQMQVRSREPILFAKRKRGKGEKINEFLRVLTSHFRPPPSSSSSSGTALTVARASPRPGAAWSSSWTKGAAEPSASPTSRRKTCGCWPRAARTPSRQPSTSASFTRCRIRWP